MSAGAQASNRLLAPAADEFTRGYRAWMLFILMLMNALNLADRQGLAAVAPALKRDLHLSDTELGVIQGLGFAIFYTLLGLPIARTLCETVALFLTISSCPVLTISLPSKYDG